MGGADFCPRCGSRVEPGAGTCPTCGADLGSGAAPPGATGPPSPGGTGWRRFPVLPLALVVGGLAVMLVAVLVPLVDDGGGRGGGEVFLEAASAEGPSPFTAAVDPAVPASSVVAAPVAGPVAAPSSGVVPVSGMAPAPGSPPYGGSGDDRVCDRGQLIGFLTSQPARAAAWAGVLGVAVDQIPTYVRSLTPTVLLYDTRVTNHGYAGGRATPRQSVLQAGTAVLVDAAGNPVVRCRCGNPLLPPVVVAPTTVGTPWPGYDAGTLVAVSQGVTGLGDRERRSRLVDDRGPELVEHDRCRLNDGSGGRGRPDRRGPAGGRGADRRGDRLRRRHRDAGRRRAPRGLHRELHRHPRRGRYRR